MVASEPENGTYTSPADKIADSSASGGSAVLFGRAATPPPPPPAPSPSPTPPTTSTAYYVDCTGGSDSNSGLSQSAAWSSLAKANAAPLGSSKGIYFKRGCSWSGGTLNISWSGATISNYGSGALPVFKGSGDSSNHVNITGDNNIIDGIAAIGSNSKCSTCTGAAFNFANGATGNTLKNSQATGKWAGVYLRDGANNNRITNNAIKDNKMLQDRGGSNDDTGAFGVLIHGAGNDVSYNHFSGQNAPSPDYGLDGSSVEFYTLSGNAPASNNKIHHNISVNDNTFSEMGKQSTAQSPSGNVFAYNTYVTTGISNAIFINTRGSGTNYGPINGTLVYNNSVYITGSTKAALICGGTCTASILIARNNIIVTSGNPISGSGSFSNNLTSSPYVAPPNDLHLKAGSAAVDKGTSDAISAGFTTDLDGIKLPYGSAVDIGAYEYH